VKKGDQMYIPNNIIENIKDSNKKVDYLKEYNEFMIGFFLSIWPAFALEDKQTMRDLMEESAYRFISLKYQREVLGEKTNERRKPMEEVATCKICGGQSWIIYKDRLECRKCKKVHPFDFRESPEFWKELVNNEKARCPKCGCDYIRTDYQEYDRIKRTCRRCSYFWTELPLDYMRSEK